METRVIIAATAGFVVGGVAGFFVTKEVLGRQNEHYINSEIQEGNDYWHAHWKNIYAKPDLKTMTEVDSIEAVVADIVSGKTTPLAADWIAERLATRDVILDQMRDQVEEYDQTDDEEPEEVDTVDDEDSVELNVFTEAAKVQDPTIPRLISVEEFMEDCQDYDKISLTYFEGDGTTIDDRQQTPVDNIERLIGDQFSSNWGLNSKDPNVVYVRNMALEVDFEVMKDPRTYEDWVLGPLPKQALKKMREDD